MTDLLVVPEPVYVQYGGEPWVFDGSPRVRVLGDAADPGLLAGVLGLEQGDDPAVTFELTDTDRGDEGYEVVVDQAGATITADRPAGLFWGAQTLRQLMSATSGGTVPGLRLRDRPRFSWRGLMLDVARHFFSVDDVKHVIDLAASYKLNVLHLHLTDDQGWRITIDSWPELTTVGGRTAVGGGAGGYYSKSDYAALVDYAARRSITVVPEFDVPGHTQAALASYPELTRDGRPVRPSTGTEVGRSALTIDNAITYRFVEDVFGELAEMTPGPYLHLGGDEALTLTADEYVPFVERVQKIVAATGKTPVGWQEIATAGLLPGVVVQYWNTAAGPASAVEAVGKGARLVMSPANRVYLDMKYSTGTELGLDWAGYVDVRDAYDWDPATEIAGVGADDVLGVEAALWTETVTTRSDVERMVLPRLPAVAEVAWSAAAYRDWPGLRRRLAGQAPSWAAQGMSFYRSSQVDWPA